MKGRGRTFYPVEKMGSAWSRALPSEGGAWPFCSRGVWFSLFLALNHPEPLLGTGEASQSLRAAARREAPSLLVAGRNACKSAQIFLIILLLLTDLCVCRLLAFPSTLKRCGEALWGSAGVPGAAVTWKLGAGFKS